MSIARAIPLAPALTAGCGGGEPESEEDRAVRIDVSLVEEHGEWR